MTEAGVDDGVDCSDAGAGQHGDGAFDGEGHINDHAVSFFHSQRLQTVGEAAEQAVKLAVGDGSLAAIFAEPDEGGAIAAVGFSMAVERVDGDVGPGAGEPLVMYSLPLQHTIPFARPRKSGCVLSPETLGILPGAVALC